MKIVVQKFGGTSVSNEENRKSCFKHIKKEIEKGYKVIVVVSAMGREGDPYSTDSLLSLAPNSNTREKDLLMNTGELISACIFSSELNQINIRNKVLTGGQAGIITNNTFNQAGIIDLKPERIFKEFKENNVLVVTGFQGITIDQEITTLGRGGSDTSAAALAASVAAEYLDIFTDVEGVMTADPRIVDNAHIITKTTYNEICNLAHMGAKVIHPRAVEIAMQYNIPVRVRSTFSDFEGTLITNLSELNFVDDKNKFITGITQTNNIVQFIIDCNMSYEVQNDLFSELEEKEVSLDLINISQKDICFTVNKDRKSVVSEVLSKKNLKYTIKESVTKISLVGAGMAGVPGVVRKIVNTLYKEDIPILQTTDSHTTFWILVPEKDSIKAIRSLHNTFCVN